MIRPGHPTPSIVRHDIVVFGGKAGCLNRAYPVNADTHYI